MVAKLLAAIAVALAASSDGSRPRVDVALVLAVDPSGSVSGGELDLQKEGYASALTSPEVQAAIRSGVYGRIAISYCEWSNRGSFRVFIPWTIVADVDSASAFGRLIVQQPRLLSTRHSGGTSISDAIRQSI
jgi:hypothetical protein